MIYYVFEFLIENFIIWVSPLLGTKACCVVNKIKVKGTPLVIVGDKLSVSEPYQWV